MFQKIVLLVTAIIADVRTSDWAKALLDISELLIFLGQPAQRGAKMLAGDPDEAAVKAAVADLETCLCPTSKPPAIRRESLSRSCFPPCSWRSRCGSESEV